MVKETAVERDWVINDRGCFTSSYNKTPIWQPFNRSVSHLVDEDVISVENVGKRVFGVVDFVETMVVDIRYNHVVVRGTR